MGPPVLIVWNAKSGSTEYFGELRDSLAALDGVHLIDPAEPDESRELASRISADEFPVIAAAGGDGTVNTIVQGLLQNPHPPALAVLPLGSGNDFCRTLAIPPDPAAAVQLLQAAQIRPIDVGHAVSPTAGARAFVNMVTGGNTGRVMESLTSDVKQFWGPLCYLRGALDILAELQEYRLTITCDDQPPETYSAINILVANGRYSGRGLPAAPDASLEDGLLDVIVIHDTEPVDLAVLATQFVLSDYLQNEHVELRRARRVLIESDPPLPLSIDGELFDHSPLEITVQPSALRVLVGPDYIPERPAAIRGE